MKNIKALFPIILFGIIYYLANEYRLSFILYPINLFVTFLHEFGHEFFALITGGSVESLKINPNGSGLATTSGGIRAFVLMGGYIGSAIFGSLLIYYSTTKQHISSYILRLLMGLMIFSAIFWFDNIFTSLVLFSFSAGLFFIDKYNFYEKYILQFVGISSLIYIIRDFKVGPSGDLEQFSKLFIIIPQFVWMYIWLGLVIYIIYFTFKRILSDTKHLN